MHGSTKSDENTENTHFFQHRKTNVTFFSRLRRWHQGRYITLFSNRHGAASPSHPRKDALCAASRSALTTGHCSTNGSHTRQMLKSREKHGGKAVRNWSKGEPFCHCEKLLLSTTPECPVFTRVLCSRGSPGCRGVRPMSDKTFHSDCTTLVVWPELAGR